MTTTFSEVNLKLELSLKDALTQLVQDENFNCEFKFIQPLKIKLKKFLFEDDFTETNMLADLLSISIIYSDRCYLIEANFDFKPYENYNLPLFNDTFYPNKHTLHLPFKELYNAVETKNYEDKYSAYLGNFDFIDDKLPQFVIDALDEFLEII